MVNGTIYASCLNLPLDFASSINLRQECLDHFLILNEGHLTRVLREYVKYYNTQRPHQGIKQQLPIGPVQPLPIGGKIISFPVLNGLHQAYQRTAYGSDGHGSQYS
ncbi:MAG TPA: integrase core domain-containing protein [Chloroflexia bacterium]|nr:integrase core domain-containing protein [Chloroflexia bacterium]